jgi:ATP-binding protein involved in chromosome partitioning
MTLTKDLVRSALATVPVPSTLGGGTLASNNAVLWIAACDGYAALKLQLPPAATPDHRADVAARAEIALQRAAAQAGTDLIALSIDFVAHDGSVIERIGDAAAAHRANQQAPQPTPQPRPKPPAPPPASTAPTPQDNATGLPGVRHVVAVGAGKGGVGKSTIAVNLAVCLARRGHAVGVLDADIYGPSFPTLLGLDALELTILDGKIQPFLVHGVKAATIGKMVDPDKPLIWRGPMAHGAVKQLIDRTNWGELDYLIVDLPPGTGDVPLTLAQSLRLSGAVVVCTPQKVAQDDASRAARMFQQLGIEVLGVVENMSYFIADDAKEYDIFGRGGAELMAQRLGLPFLGTVPITMALRANSDSGEPLKNFDPATSNGPALHHALERLTKNLQAQLALASMAKGHSRPTLSIS